MTLTNKEKIIKTAITLFSEKGINTTTLDDIASTSGVPLEELSKFFPDKVTLITIIGREVYQQNLNKMTEIMLDADSISDGIRGLIKFYLSTYETSPEEFQILLLLGLGEHTPSFLPEFTLTDLCKVFLIAYGLSEDNAVFAANAAIGVVNQTCLNFIHGRLPKPILEYTDQCTAACMAIFSYFTELENVDMNTKKHLPKELFFPDDPSQ